MHEQVWWSAKEIEASVTPATSEFPEQSKEITKGRLTLNNTG